MCSGNAIHLAAVNAREQIVEAAANMMECSEEDIELRDGAAWVRGTARSATLAEIATAANPLRYAFNKPSASATQFAPARRHDGPQLAEGRAPGVEATEYYSPPHASRAFGVHAAVIEVDPELCTIEVKRYICVHDCGKMINPTIVEGQVMGGSRRGSAAPSTSAASSMRRALRSTPISWIS